MQLNREDVQRIVENMIRERELISRDELIQGLSIHVTGGDPTDPNRRHVVVKFNNMEIASDYFSVVQKPEYKG